MLPVDSIALIAIFTDGPMRHACALYFTMPNLLRGPLGHMLPFCKVCLNVRDIVSPRRILIHQSGDCDNSQLRCCKNLLRNTRDAHNLSRICIYYVACSVSS